MKNELIQVLKNLGLNDKEAKVYLANTEVGAAPVSTIAQTANINRVTTYDILEKLKQKGIANYYSKNKTKFYSCQTPQILLEEYEKRTNDFRISLPKFKRLTGEINHPRVRYFEGIMGIKAIFADTLTSKTEILNFSNSDQARQRWKNYDEEYVQKRADKKIFLRGICPKDEAGKKVQAEDKKYHREMRLISPEKFDFTNEINIYDNKVSIISFKDELIGMIIESAEIANSQKAIFNMCWDYVDFIENTDIKNKLLEPLHGRELEKTIQKIQEPKKESKKVEEEEEKNLSLF